MVYVNHFVLNLQPDHGPVILFLDGHGSRWNKHALLYLMRNNVFPFILASHTSIWSQPNDAGVNKRFHWAIKQSCKKIRCTIHAPTVEYFNTNLVNGWREFLTVEHDDLRSVQCNNAMNAFLCTGLYPYNPFAVAWTDAIQTIGKAQQHSGAAQYKSFPTKDAAKLTEAESVILRHELDLADPTAHDVEVAHIRSLQILGRWRKDIEKAVSEGEDYNTYLHALLPSPKTEPEKIAMQLVHFRKIETNHLCPAGEKKSRKEIANEITKQIVHSTKKAQAIAVTAYLSSSSQSDDNSESNTQETSPGIAVKMCTNKWHVVLENDTDMTVSDDELMDSNKYYVQKLMSSDNDETMQKKQAAKQKRARKAEKLEQEKEIREKGLQKRRELELEQFNNLRKRFESGATPYEFEEFLEMVDLMRQPFVCQIDGHEVSLTQDDCNIMMETSAVKAITESLFKGT